MFCVLVTGAAGFLGSRITSSLAASGNVQKVFAVDLVIGNWDSVHGCTVTPLVLDFLSDELELPVGIDTLVHAAGEKSDSSRMEAVNHVGTENLIRAASRAGIRRFVYLSSVGVYGAAPHSGLVKEHFPHTPRNIYEQSKDAGERSVRQLCPELGIEFIVLQPSNVLGLVPGRSWPLLGLMRSVLRGRFAWFGSGDSWVNYVSVQDVAAAVVFASLNAPAGSTYIVNTPERLSLLIDWVCQELSCPVPGSRLPLWVGGVAAALGDLMERVTGNGAPLNRAKLLEIVNTTRYDGTALSRETGFHYPVGLQELVRTLAQEYRRAGLL